VTEPTPMPCTNVGFLSVQQEPSGFVGGYLVTNLWGRPLEFRLSSAVQPNKVQTILYGDTLQGFLCSEVIAKTLIDKTITPIALLLIDNPLSFDVRIRIDVPVGLWHRIVDPDSPVPGVLVQSRLYCHSEFSGDVEVLQTSIAKTGLTDFSEPFTRIREAMIEARKMGVTRSTAA
jgi:hypothetical protein